MSPRLRRLSGRQVVRILESFDFVLVSQRGSHVKLRRTVGGARQTLTVPNHNELDAGTAQGIFRQAARYVSEERLRPHFYGD